MRLLFVGELVVVVLGLGAIAGCGGTPSNLGAGEACVRSAQCAPGLACNMGMCTNDLSGFGTGVVPSGDAGVVEVDAAADDGGVVEIDAGPPVDTDAGTTPVDAGPPEMDAGPPEMDAGPPETDAGPPETDAGPPETDAGPTDLDAGV
ncbi:MAG: hypothetical protein M3Y87_28510 [Myxococcota bacterium]|nr:hypothetical protein [Myxococcota bacterium]